MKSMCSLVLWVVASGCSGTSEGGISGGDGSSSGGDGGTIQTTGSSGGTMGGGSGGTNSGGSTQTGGQITPTGVTMVVGVGSGFQTMVSCDDGLTWREGRAVPGGKCVADGDCSHDPGRALGLAYSNGWFIAPFGNEGNDSQIRRSRDGLIWERVYDRSTGGMAVGKGRVVANSNPALYSDDDGATWKAGVAFKTLNGANNARGAVFIPYDGGRFLLHYDTGGTKDMMHSRDGITFTRPDSYPQGCGPSGIAYGNNIIVMTTNDGKVCRSTDGGLNWMGPVPLMATGLSTPTDNLRAILWTGQDFIAYHWDNAFRSTDGITWASVKVTPGGAHVGTNIRGISGRWVTAHGGNTAAFATSPDGLNWKDSPGTRDIFIHEFVAGHGLASGCPIP